MHPGVLPGGDLTRPHSGFVFQVDVSVGGDAITPFGRFPLHNLHRADRAGVIMGKARLAGQPGHHQQLVVFPQYDLGTVVALSIPHDVGRNVGGGEFTLLERVRQGHQRRTRSQSVEFLDKFMQSAVRFIHDINLTHVLGVGC